MWLCEDKLNRKTAHFRLPSVAQKQCMLKLPNAYNFVFDRVRCKAIPSSFGLSFYPHSIINAAICMRYGRTVLLAQAPTDHLLAHTGLSYKGKVGREKGEVWL